MDEAAGTQINGVFTWILGPEYRQSKLERYEIASSPCLADDG